MVRMTTVMGGLVAGLLVSGCSTSMGDLLGGDEPATQTNARAAPDLTMPPDLQLNPPGTVAQTPAETQVAAAPEEDFSQPAATPAPAPQGDVYERNGISKTHPDGKPKTDAELKEELRQVYLAKKKQGNPNYGTVFNIGNIFKDE